MVSRIRVIEAKAAPSNACCLSSPDTCLGRSSAKVAEESKCARESSYSNASMYDRRPNPERWGRGLAILFSRCFRPGTNDTLIGRPSIVLSNSDVSKISLFHLCLRAFTCGATLGAITRAETLL